MNAFAQYRQLTLMQFQMARDFAWFIAMVQVAFTVGLVIGFGYLIPDISNTTALYLTTGAATQAIVTIGLVGLPQLIAEGKAQGRLEYFLTLPLSREAYLLSLATMSALLSLPGVALAVALGAWHYDLSLDVSPWVVAVVPLALLSLMGVGIALAILSPHQQLTNAITQLVIFYVLLFAPVMIPKEQLPSALRAVAVVFPTTYAADAVRATLTDLPGTHLYRSLSLLVVFTGVSLVASSIVIRRRA